MLQAQASTRLCADPAAGAPRSITTFDFPQISINLVDQVLCTWFDDARQQSLQFAVSYPRQSTMACQPTNLMQILGCACRHRGDSTADGAQSVMKRSFDPGEVLGH